MYSSPCPIWPSFQVIALLGLKFQPCGTHKGPTTWQQATNSLWRVPRLLMTALFFVLLGIGFVLISRRLTLHIYHFWFRSQDCFFTLCPDLICGPDCHSFSMALLNNFSSNSWALIKINQFYK